MVFPGRISDLEIVKMGVSSAHCWHSKLN